MNPELWNRVGYRFRYILIFSFPMACCRWERNQQAADNLTFLGGGNFAWVKSVLMWNREEDRKQACSGTLYFNLENQSTYPRMFSVSPLSTPLVYVRDVRQSVPAFCSVMFHGRSSRDPLILVLSTIFMVKFACKKELCLSRLFCGFFCVCLCRVFARVSWRVSGLFLSDWFASKADNKWTGT